MVPKKIIYLSLTTMQTALILFFCFIYSAILGQARVEDPLNYRAIYELTYQPDSTNLEDVRKEEFLLYRGDKLSLFASKGRILQDSLAANTSLQGMGQLILLKERQRPKQTLNM